MKIDCSFEELDRLMKEMGATPTQWCPDEIILDPIAEIRKELEAGKEIPLADIKPAHGGLLTYEGQQVVLYIKSPKVSHERIKHAENGPRFHLADCQKINEMRDAGKLERYVATTRKDGLFLLEPIDPFAKKPYEIETELLVCRYCLSHINWKNYPSVKHSEKQAVWREFSLDDFFAEFATFFREKPKYTDRTAPPSGYAAEWSEISERFRRRRNWQCDECQVNLSAHRGLLHCHHKNGVTSDNNPNNIAVLCIACHAEQRDHGHMRPRPKDLSILNELRRRQRQTDLWRS